MRSILITVLCCSVISLIGCNDKETSSNCNIKGNVSQRTGEKIYHMPEQRFYDVTDAEEMFCTEEEAQEAGYRKSKR